MADRTHNTTQNSRNGRHSDRVTFRFKLSHAKQRIRDNFEDFTETLTTDLKQYISNNPQDKPYDNVFVIFDYTQEGILWVVNREWFPAAIHNFANKYNIPIQNILYIAGSATIQESYDKWHSIYRPTEGKMKCDFMNFGFLLYGKYNKYFDILTYTESAPTHIRSKKFNCLNANMGLYHRIKFMAEMDKNGLLSDENLKNNLQSYHLFFLHSNIPYVSELQEKTRQKCPIQFDVKGDWKQVYNKIFERSHDVTGITDWNKTGDYRYIYENCYFTVTTESGECPELCHQFDDEELDNYVKHFIKDMFITEKTTRPILNLHPQILYSTTGTLEYLKNQGFKTFNNYWNEDYDNEPRSNKKIQMIVDVVKKLNNKSLDELHEMYWDMMPILKHNQSLLLERNEFKQITFGDDD